MSELCASCGAELFAGQQFCRRCGAPTRQFSTVEIPTQILPEARGGPPQQQGARDAAPPAHTTPLGPRETGETGAGYPSRFAGHRPPAPPRAQGGGRTRRVWPWALLAVLVASAVISAVVARRLAFQTAARKGAAARRIVKANVPKAEAPDIPLPPPLVSRGDEAGEPLDEEDAEVAGDKTVITETFPLGEDGRLSIANTAGDITVEGWDGEEAEVRITKRGGTAADRAAVRIMRAESARCATR
jgi:hypothetical protein